MHISLRASNALLLIALTAPAARAQTDFYNTDRGLPLHTEAAIVIERRAFELQAAPTGTWVLQLPRLANRHVLRLNGALADWFAAQGLQAHVTLTDESDYAASFVVVEKAPTP